MEKDNATAFILRRRLRTELLAARQGKELTQQSVAEAMHWSMSKMNRIEKAKSGISHNDLKALLEHYEITDKKQTDYLLDLAKEARQVSWWRKYSDVADSEFLELMDYESASSDIRQFETMFVPGILQTEDYASAILRALNDGKPAERVPRLVDLRTRRRDLLTRENAPNFSFVLDETIIRRPIGSPAIMSHQLQHLVRVTKELPNVTIQIVPFSMGPYLGMKGAFEHVHFEDTPDDDIVFLEGSSGDVVSDTPETVNSYLEAFKRITSVSLNPADSADRLLRAAGDLG